MLLLLIGEILELSRGTVYGYLCVIDLPAGAVRIADLPARQPAATVPGGADEALTSTSPVFPGAQVGLHGALSAGSGYTTSDQPQSSAAPAPPVEQTEK